MGPHEASVDQFLKRDTTAYLMPQFASALVTRTFPQSWSPLPPERTHIRGALTARRTHICGVFVGSRLRRPANAVDIPLETRVPRNSPCRRPRKGEGDPQPQGTKGHPTETPARPRLGGKQPTDPKGPSGYAGLREDLLCDEPTLGVAQTAYVRRATENCRVFRQVDRCSYQPGQYRWAQ